MKFKKGDILKRTNFGNENCTDTAKNIFNNASANHFILLVETEKNGWYSFKTNKFNENGSRYFHKLTNAYTEMFFEKIDNIFD